MILCVSFITFIKFLPFGRGTLYYAVSVGTAVMQDSDFLSNFDVAEDVGDAGEPQALAKLERALQGPPVVLLLLEEEVDIVVLSPVEGAGRVSPSVSGELPYVVSVLDLVELSFIVMGGALWMRTVVIRQSAPTLILLWRLLFRLKVGLLLNQLVGYVKLFRTLRKA